MNDKYFQKFEDFSRINVGISKNSNKKSNPAKFSNIYSTLFDNDINKNSIYPDTGATVIYVKSTTKLTNEKPSTGMQIGSCLKHILHSRT